MGHRTSKKPAEIFLTSILQNCILNLEIVTLWYVRTEITHFMHCAIAGSCTEPNKKKQKGGCNRSEERWESKQPLSECLDFLVGMPRST